jgi:tetratricopeptide (TPR) repeat protein
LRGLGRPAEARAAYAAARDLLERLAADLPGEPAHPRDLAAAEIPLGELARDAGAAAAALAWADQAVAHLMAALQTRPDLPAARPLLAHAHGGRAAAHERLGRYDEAALAWGRALELNADPGRTALLTAGRQRSRLAAGLLASPAWPLLWGWPR